MKKRFRWENQRQRLKTSAKYRFRPNLAYGSFTFVSVKGSMPDTVHTSELQLKQAGLCRRVLLKDLLADRQVQLDK